MAQNTANDDEHKPIDRNLPDHAETVKIALPITIETETELEEDPVAGTCGTKVELVEEPCTCGSRIARHSAHYPAGVHHVECVACGLVHEQG